MIVLSSIIHTFEADFLARYQDALLPSHRKALAAMKQCRTTQSPMMLAQCGTCDSQKLIPHSCGHRHCPHCQHHDKSAGKPICTASAARRVKVHGCTFMIVSNGSNANAKNNSPPSIF